MTAMAIKTVAVAILVSYGILVFLAGRSIAARAKFERKRRDGQR